MSLAPPTEAVHATGTVAVFDFFRLADKIRFPWTGGQGTEKHIAAIGVTAQVVSGISFWQAGTAIAPISVRSRFE